MLAQPEGLAGPPAGQQVNGHALLTTSEFTALDRG